MNTLFPDVLAPFYELALTVNPSARPTAVLERVLADDFASINGQEIKNKATLIRQLEYFWTLIPDLRWEPQEEIAAGNKAVVRSIATGSPKGEFMGLTLDGSRAFRIDTIDIHTIAGNRIKTVYHLEDWATALRQLKG